MLDVCWIHNQRFHLGDHCPECLKRDREWKQSLADDEPAQENVKKREPGDRLWGVVKTLVLINLALWVLIVLGAVVLR